MLFINTLDYKKLTSGIDRIGGLVYVPGRGGGEDLHNFCIRVIIFYTERVGVDYDEFRCNFDLCSHTSKRKPLGRNYVENCKIKIDNYNSSSRHIFATTLVMMSRESKSKNKSATPHQDNTQEPVKKKQKSKHSTSYISHTFYSKNYLTYVSLFITTDTQIEKFQREIDKIKTEAKENINKIKAEAEENNSQLRNSQHLLKDVLKNMKMCNPNSGM